MYRWGTIIWTANSACWFMIAYITGDVIHGIVSLACLGMAACWNELFGDGKF